MHKLVVDLDRTRTLGLAAELAFWLFLSLIPIIAVAGMVAAKIAVENADVGYQALDPLPAPVRELVAHQVSQVADWNGGWVGFKAGVTFVWLASSGVHAVFDAIELKSGTSRPWWKKRVLALGGCVVLSFGVALLAVLLTGLTWASDLVSGALPRGGVGGGSLSVSSVVRLLAGLGAALSLVAGLYWVGFPPKARAVLPIWPGAVLAVATQIALGLGYGQYISRMGLGSAYSAGLAVIGVTLVTLYLICLALLVGAQFNVTLADVRREASAAVQSSRMPPSAR